LSCFTVYEKLFKQTLIAFKSAFHPSGIGKSSTSLSGWGQDRAPSPVSGDS